MILKWNYDCIKWTMILHLWCLFLEFLFPPNACFCGGLCMHKKCFTKSILKIFLKVLCISFLQSFCSVNIWYLNIYICFKQTISLICRLLGPRKKICMAISQYQQEQSEKSFSKETANIDNLLIENKKLHLVTEKVRFIFLILVSK